MSNAHVRQELTRILEKMRDDVRAAAEPRLMEGARYLSSIAWREMAGFHDVTGNTKNSIAVGLFYDGKLVGIATSFNDLHHGPTRMTLVGGEVYDLPRYWDGTQIAFRAYRAPKDSPQKESFWAQDEAMDFVRSVGVGVRKGWRYVIVSAVDYAKYLEAKNKVNVLSNLQSELASMGADVSYLR